MIAVLVVFAILTVSIRIGIASQAGDPVIAAAGDIACDPNNPNFKGGNGTANGCAEVRTSNKLATDSTVDLVLGLGDFQYSCDDLNDYTLSYTPSWGVFNSIMYPVAGNHEYQTGTDPFGAMCPATNTTAANYFWYFGVNADPNNNGGHFSFDRGSWHIIGLNANCSSVGGCNSSSPETVWLSNDLNSTTQPCILAYWHQPYWTGLSTNDFSSSAWWSLLYQKHADIVLNGHVHNYQRFPKLNPSGQQDSQGIREVIVGTGGESNQVISSAANPQPEVFYDSKTFGYLRMVLHPTSYDASFVKYDGTVLDTFSGTCNSIAPTPTPTPLPTPSPTPTPAPTATPTPGPITMDGLPAHGTASSSTVISATLPNPVGGLSNGDWAGCVISVNASSTLTPPAQYALVPNTLQTSTTIASGVYYHIWHTGDPTSALIFQSSVNGNLSYICAAYKGVNQTSPYDGSSSLHNSASTIATSPAVNGHANDVLLMLYGVLGSPHTFTTASEGTIENSLSSGPAAAWVDFPLTTNGLTGSQSVTFSGNANASNGIQIALLSGGTPTPPPTAPRVSTQSLTTIPTPGPSVSPSSLDFGKQATETASVPQVVTLTNNESGAVTINGVSITGPNATDFAVWSSTCGSTLGSGSNCAISIIFEPSARGKRVAKLTIGDSPDSGSPHTVSLSGIGATGA